jgi:6,7-dimethyl-8-ribityllumazine synthase
MSHARSLHPTRPAPDLSGCEVLRAPTMAPEGARIAIIAAQWNAEVVDGLLEGALRALGQRGIARERITVVRVPGAWELPQAALGLAREQRHAAIVALGCVIRGETAHFDIIANESARGLMDVALAHHIVVSNGVLACENEQQARARAGGTAGNKGEEAALAALDMIGTLAAARAAR